MDTLYRSTENLTLPTSRMLKAALDYADRGIPTFPCRHAHAEKDPKAPLTGKGGFHKATTDPRKVHAFWNKHRGASIGVPTGERFWILDVDDIDALGKLELQCSRTLPETRTVRTPRGGLHFYFRAAEGVTNRTGALPEGIDVRGRGGYVLAPPSPGYTVENHAPIAEPPEWLLEVLRAEPRRAEGPTGNRAPTTSINLADGERIPGGARNNNLTRIAGRLHDETRSLDQLAADLLEVNAARCDPPLPEAEVLKIAASIHRKPPCRPTAPEAAPEVLEVLDEVEAQNLWGREWRGTGWKVPRSVLVTLVKEARQHGTLIPAGVRISMSTRSLALAAAASHPSILKAIRRLREAEIIRKDDADRSGTQAGAFVLVAPRAKVNHSPTAFFIHRELVVKLCAPPSRRSGTGGAPR